MDQKYSYIIRRLSDAELEKIKSQRVEQAKQNEMYDSGEASIEEPCRFVVIRTESKTGKKAEEELSKVSDETLYCVLTDYVHILQDSMETRNTMKEFYAEIDKRVSPAELGDFLALALQEDMPLFMAQRSFGYLKSYKEATSLAGVLAHEDGGRKTTLCDLLDASEILTRTAIKETEKTSIR